MKFESTLTSLLAGNNLRATTCEALFMEFFRGSLSQAQAKASLLLLAKKGETCDEILGCLKAIKRLEPPFKTSFALLDTCGTGGDKSNSLNISTLAALVIAGAGVKVAKHGNRSISSRCGSSDLLEHLGLPLNQSREQTLKSIQKAGMGYFHAPAHHPVFSKVQGLRKELGVRTLFNLLGPLLNPLVLRYQLIGVSNPAIFNHYIRLAQRTKATVLICCSLDGLDEISIYSPTQIALIKKGNVTRSLISPRDFGISYRSTKAIRGDSVQKNTKSALDLLQGKTQGAFRDIVLLNAAAGLWIAGKVKDLHSGLKMAARSLDSGSAYQVLQLMLKCAS